MLLRAVQRASAGKTKRGLATQQVSAERAKKARATSREKAAVVPIRRDSTPRCKFYPNALKVMSSNVAGLRAVMNKPEKKSALQLLLDTEKPSIFCIQEHKLQEQHVANLREAIEKMLPGYKQYWTCSRKPQKLGYSGVATFVRDPDPSNGSPSTAVCAVSYGLPSEDGSVTDPIATHEGQHC